MPGLTYSLNADGTGLEKGLKSAAQRVDKFRKDVSRQPLLQFERENKAERNIVGMTTELANARTGAEMLSVTLARTGDIFQNSLATGVVMAMGAALFDMAKQADEAFKNFQALSIEARKGMSKASVIGDIGDITQGLKTYDERLKAIRQEQQRQQSVAGAIGTRVNSWMGGPGVQEAMNETEKEISRLQIERANTIARINELSEQQMQIADAMARGAQDEVEALQEKFRLEKEIANIRLMGLDEEAKKKAIAAATAISEAKEKAKTAKSVQELLDGIEEDEKIIEKRRRDARKKNDEDIAEQIRKSQDDDEQLTAQKLDREKKASDAKLEQIAKEAKAKEDADAEAAKRIEAVSEKQRQQIEDRLSLDDKLRLAKERVAKAQEKAQAFRNLGENNKAAEAELAEAQGGLMDAREAQIQRIMGGSTSAAAAQRAERREQRARARAERILNKRQDIRDADAKARGEWAKPAEMNLQGGPEKDPVEAAVKEGNTMLGKVEQQLKDLNQRLTVA